MFTTVSRIVVLAAVVALVAIGFEATGSSVESASAQQVSATCSNTTTDSATIQNVINSSHAGDTILITGGQCDITTTITLLPDRTYTGTDTSGTVLTQAAGENLPGMLVAQGWAAKGEAYVDDGIRLEHMTLNGNSQNNTSGVTNVVILRNYNFRVYDIRIENAPHDGILLTTQASDGTQLTNGMINSILSDLWIDGAGYDGVQVIDPPSVNKVTDDVLERSWIDNVGHDGVDLADAAGWDVRELHIYGVQVNAIEADRCYDTSINDNYVEEFGQAGVNGTIYYGIFCGLQGGSANVISGNKLVFNVSLPSAGTFDYLAVSGNYGATYAAITGNDLLGTGTARETGLSYNVGGASSMTLSSTGNLVAGVGTARSVTGATVTAGQ